MGIRNEILNKIRKIRCIKKRKRLTNTNITILCNICIGGMMLNDLGLRFNTPTINLFISPSDFVKFISNLDEYINMELIENTQNDMYPVGRLGDISIKFMHYKSFSDAKKSGILESIGYIKRIYL